MNIEIIKLISSGFLGSILGSIISFWGMNYLQNEKIKMDEKSTILAIIAELKILKGIYEKDLDKELGNLSEEGYYCNNYDLSQNFITVYENNCDKLGLIKNKKIREGIIETYSLLKRFLEEDINYKKNYYEQFEVNRKSFISKLYPHLIDGSCTEWNTDDEIDLIIKKANKNEWNKIETHFMNQSQIQNFLQSDKIKRNELISISQILKQHYLELKKAIDNVIFEVELIYKDK